MLRAPMDVEPIPLAAARKFTACDRTDRISEVPMVEKRRKRYSRLKPIVKIRGSIYRAAAAIANPVNNDPYTNTTRTLRTVSFRTAGQKL
jgi:hypothetical protein